jgi:GNAT superfamily N-acetyltransferase
MMENLEDFGCVAYSLDNEVEFDDEGEETQGDGYVLIDLVFVKPKFRGQGYARKLLMEAIEEIKKIHSGLLIKLYALPKEKNVDLERLVNFYESCGFSTCESFGCDGIFMEL